MQNNIVKLFKNELGNIIYFAPIFFASGIIYYLTMNNEPNYFISLSAVILLAIAVYIGRNSRFFTYLLLIFCFALGFFTINSKALLVEAPIYNASKKIQDIEGIIEEIELKPNGYRIIITDAVIDGEDSKNTLKKIRVNFIGRLGNLKIGDKIRFQAFISTPPFALMPDFYDFRKTAFFRQIGAVGYNIHADIEIIERDSQNDIITWLGNFRQNIKNRLQELLPKDTASIAISLLVGDQGGISKEIYNKMKLSGLAHILSVSGFHLSLVAAILFFCSRNILLLSSKITLRYDIKKIAAFIALVGSFFYLTISGMQIPAERAFIMVGLTLLAIILNRDSSTHHNLIIALIFILLIQPEAIITPSFQMSFAAVIAIMSCWKIMLFWHNLADQHRWMIKFIYKYVIPSIVISFVASISTLPFVLYHFGNITIYSILSNLLVTPIASFIIMPAAIISLIFMPFGLDSVPVYIFGFGIEVMVKIAAFFASLPAADWIYYKMPSYILITIIISLICVAIFSTKIRYLFLLPVLIAIFLYIARDNDDKIIITKDNFVFVHKNKIISYKSIKSGIFRDNIKLFYGKKNINLLKNYPQFEGIYFAIAENNHITCSDYQIIIAYANINCDNVVYPEDFTDNKVMILNKKSYDIENYQPEILRRRWNK